MASIRREIPAAAGWWCSTWRNYTGGWIWRGGNSGMAQPNHLEGLAGESCVGHLVLHHHPQAESHSGCHSFLEHLSRFVGILLHQDVDQSSFQMWHLEYSLRMPGEHCHPNLCCFLLWPCLQWWGLSILPLLLPPPIWHLWFFSPPSWMLGVFFVLFRFCGIVIITATPDSWNRVFVLRYLHCVVVYRRIWIIFVGYGPEDTWPGCQYLCNIWSTCHWTPRKPVGEESSIGLDDWLPHHSQLPWHLLNRCTTKGTSSSSHLQKFCCCCLCCWQGTHWLLKSVDGYLTYLLTQQHTKFLLQHTKFFLQHLIFFADAVN